MIAELGHYALMLALGLSLIQATMPIVGARHDDPTLLSVAAPAGARAVRFCRLVVRLHSAVCYVTSDFSVLSSCLREFEDSAMPLMYRLTERLGQPRGLA